MVVAGVVAGLQLGLRHGRLERHVPQGRGVGEVGLAAREVAQEGHLADQLRLRPDRRVVLVPVDRQPERAPQPLVELLVLHDELLAERDEVGPVDRHLALRVGLLRRREVRVVRQRRVAPHAEVVLHPALGRQAVVVPAHRVEDGLAAHPLEAGDQVGVRVGVDVPDVQRPGHRRRRGVDRVDLVARAGPVELVGLRRPSIAPTTSPRDPPAQACPVRRRNAARRSSCTGAWCWVSMSCAPGYWGDPVHVASIPFDGMTDEPTFRVDFTTDPQTFLDSADAQLAADPVDHDGRRDGDQPVPRPARRRRAAADRLAGVVGRRPRRRGGDRRARRCGPHGRRRTRCSCCRWPTTRAGPGPCAARPRRVGRRPQRLAAVGRGLRRRARPPPGRPGRGRPAHPALRAAASWSRRSAYPAGCGRRPSTTSTWPSTGSTASCTTPTCRPAATPRRTAARSSSPTTCARRIEGGTYWFWLDEAGERVHLTGANPPGVRRGPDRPRVHASGAAPEGVRGGGGRRGVTALPRRRRPGLPLHRPGQPDVQRHLPGPRLPSRWSTR